MTAATTTRPRAKKAPAAAPQDSAQIQLQRSALNTAIKVLEAALAIAEAEDGSPAERRLPSSASSISFIEAGCTHLRPVL